MATGGRLRYWVSSCFLLIAFCGFFMMLRGVGGSKQKQTFLHLGGAYIWPVQWPSISVSIQKCRCAVFTPNDSYSKPSVVKTLLLPFPA